MNTILENEAILLKIKRDFTTNEAVKSLLKIISGLEMEIGVLKQERDEAEYKAQMAVQDGLKPKKAWLKDELIKDMQAQMSRQMIKNRDARKDMENWRNKYFSLLATQLPSTDKKEE